MKTLFELSLSSLIHIYKSTLNQIEQDSTHNGLLITNMSDAILKLRGDIPILYTSYISNKFDVMFDLIISINNMISHLEGIVYIDFDSMHGIVDT